MEHVTNDATESCSESSHFGEDTPPPPRASKKRGYQSSGKRCRLDEHEDDLIDSESD